jgi:hypothetical protein
MTTNDILPKTATFPKTATSFRFDDSNKEMIGIMMNDD